MALDAGERMGAWQPMEIVFWLVFAALLIAAAVIGGIGMRAKLRRMSGRDRSDGE